MRTVVCDTQAVVDLPRAVVPTVVCDFVDLRRANRVRKNMRKIITPLT